MYGYQKGNKLYFVNKDTTSAENAQLLVDIDHDNTAIYINGRSLGEGTTPTAPSDDLNQVKADVEDLKQRMNNLNIHEDGTVDSASIVDHNLDPQSHNDIRNALKDTDNKVNSKADSDVVNGMNDRLTLAEEDIDALQNDIAVFINTAQDAALKSASNVFTKSNTFNEGIILQKDLVLAENAKITDSNTGNTVLTTITVDSNTQQAYLGLHKVWVKGPDEILLESGSIKTKRTKEDGSWVEYTNIDTGNINTYAINNEELTAALEHYVTTDQTIELIDNHISVDNLAKEVLIDSPTNATNGTLTVDQLNILQMGDANFLMFNNEKYYLNDKGSQEGYLTYSHTGYENNTPIIKTITVTVNTRSWVLNTAELNNAVIKYVTISSPASATNGNLSAEDVATLQSSKSNKIVFDNEIYNLQDNQHEDGYLIYSHVGHNSTGDFMVKCITLTVSTRSWVLSTTDVQKTYCYYITGKVTEDNLNIGTVLYSYEDSTDVNTILKDLGAEYTLPCSVTSNDIVSNKVVTGFYYGDNKPQVVVWSTANAKYMRYDLTNINMVKLF